MADTQLSLFGIPLNKSERIDYIKKTTHFGRLYKKCAKTGCDNEIPNKKRSHFCIDHLMDFAQQNEEIISWRAVVRA